MPAAATYKLLSVTEALLHLGEFLGAAHQLLLLHTDRSSTRSNGGADGRKGDDSVVWWWWWRRQHTCEESADRS